MSFRLRGVRSPLPPFIYPPDSPIRFDEARFGAWARALGHEAPYPLLGRRPHRGTLPDVDFSRAELIPRGPMLIVRLWHTLFGRRASDRPAECPESKDGPVAECDRPSHMTTKPPAASSTSISDGFKNCQAPRRAA